MGLLKRIWGWLPRIHRSPQRPTIGGRRIDESMAMLKAGCWLDRASYEGLRLTDPLTSVEIYRDFKDGLMIPEFTALIEWSGENVKGQIVYEIIDVEVETSNGAISYTDPKTQVWTTKLRKVRVGCRHVFGFTDPDSAFAFKMRWA